MGSYSSVSYLLIHLVLYTSINAQHLNDHISRVPNLWTNNPSSLPHHFSNDGSKVRLIYQRETQSFSFGFGFYCDGIPTKYLLSVFLFYPSGYTIQVVWSSNRNDPVGENATLKFTKQGDLILKDGDGRFVWSTNTTGRSIVGLNLTERGNLVLFNNDNTSLWQSYDHPTDSLILGQKLVAGQRLIASTSRQNWSEGILSLSVTDEGLFASIASNPSFSYYLYPVVKKKTNIEPSYVRFQNGSLAIYILQAEPEETDVQINIQPSSNIQHMRFGFDGHLRVYEWESSTSVEVSDVFSMYLDECDYPLVCGRFGICKNGQCSCPVVVDENGRRYFLPLDHTQPNLGCIEVTPLSRTSPQFHRLLDLPGIHSFSHMNGSHHYVDIESCKQSCLQNCSCKAAFFYGGLNDTSGTCFLQYDVYSLVSVKKENGGVNTHSFIKVQVTPDAPKKRNAHGIRVIFLLGAFFSLILISFVLLMIKKKASNEDDSFLDLPGMPTRFTYKELKSATGKFCKKLGEGGFGSVYEGVMINSLKVAVKRLDGLGKIRKSFLTEVETIGSIHHVNLVRLIGFCADKSHRLLVYEYMCNGSLDKWIFHGNSATLDWKTRKKIIYDISKGLVYLHEDCRQKILHLDIKPQNILLDNNFNAKVSDFGLSKLIDKDQSTVMTTMRGTPGYLAPEWLGSVITDKVDVYSFGVVLMEILCGRKNFDFTQPEESVHLLGMVEKSSGSDLYELIDKHCEDMQLHKEEATEMMKVAVWCLQSDFSKRPSMSVVLKVLEGAMEVETNLNSDLLTTLPPPMHNEVRVCSSVMLPSLLSGPR